MEFKAFILKSFDRCSIVDIETEWNLKYNSLRVATQNGMVDIETEWNLKQLGGLIADFPHQSRYRNRVEFKVYRQ